jgi:predicted membrane channel-forming protein YqfA (hemolysin III family)
MSRRLRISGILLILGLLVEAITLHWNTAPSFLTFMLLGGALLAAGVIIYLWSLLHNGQAQPPRE